MAALTARGAEARFVGGCVRDAVLGRPVADIDIATHDPPETVIALLEAAGIRAVPTGIDHGTITAVTGGAHFEITTLRRDVETYGRRAKVAFTDDWTADAARRDFTFNALFCAPDGTLYDAFDGLADLRAGCVRFVGDARERIREDVLRLLRFFRFFAHYGNPPPDAEALAACRELAPCLPTLSGERVRAELFRLLAAPEPASVVALMAKEGVLAHLLPEPWNIPRLAALAALDPGLGTPDPLRRLAALVVHDGDGALALAARLRLTGAERDRLVAIAAALAEFTPPADKAARRRWVYRHGAALFRDLVLLHWAGATAGGSPDDPVAPRTLDALTELEAPPIPEFPLKGRDVLALGVPRGPAVGTLLAAVEDWWVAGDFQADREGCLNRLAALAAAATANRDHICGENS